MDSQAIKLLLVASILIPFEALASFHFDFTVPGVCTTPRLGGEHDLCMQCASSCVKTCDNPTGGFGKDCFHVCVRDQWQCAENYVRGPNHKCMLLEECPHAGGPPHPIINPRPYLVPGHGPNHPEHPVCTGGVHDIFTTCGSSCPAICGVDRSQMVCAAQCKVNVCECEKGYARASNGQCIPENECPHAGGPPHPIINPGPHPVPAPGPNHTEHPVCTGGVHDIFTTCGSSCPAICGVDRSQMVCAAQCKVNVCECEKGYARASNGQCIPENECPHAGGPPHPIINPGPHPVPAPGPNHTEHPVCTGGVHDIFTTCGSSCPAICGVDRSQMVCAAQCKVNVCECEKGYARASNGQCIPENECPHAGGPPHPIINPGPHPVPAPGPNHTEHPVCTGGVHDIFTTCGSSCPAICGVDRSQMVCAAQCKVNVCECEKGYARASNGQCIPENECPHAGGPPHTITNPGPHPVPGPGPNHPEHPVCTGGVHDIFTTCGSSCPAICGVDRSQMLCAAQCKVNVCECEKGYARASNGQCIPVNECPPINSNGHPSMPPSKPLPTRAQSSSMSYSESLAQASPMKPLPSMGQSSSMASSQSAAQSSLMPNLPSMEHPSPSMEHSSPMKSLPSMGQSSSMSSAQSSAQSSSMAKSESMAHPPELESLPAKKLAAPYLYSDIDSSPMKPMPPSESPESSRSFTSFKPSASSCPICTGGEHDHCVECGSSCPPTCGEPDDRICTMECRVNVCQCEDGYKRGPDGKCVRPEQCPQIDPVPPQSCTDDETSPLIDPTPPPKSGVMHEPVCPVCTGGHHDHCVKCGSSCPAECGKSPDRACTMECRVNVCQCDEGYARNDQGDCILEEMCPAIDPVPLDCESEEDSSECPVCTGGPHDHCSACGSACPAVCGVPRDDACTKQCVVNVCECDEGYARNMAGYCIVERECNPDADKDDSGTYSSEDESVECSDIASEEEECSDFDSSNSPSAEEFSEECIQEF